MMDATAVGGLEKRIKVLEDTLEGLLKHLIDGTNADRIARERICVTLEELVEVKRNKS